MLWSIVNERQTADVLEEHERRFHVLSGEQLTQTAPIVLVRARI